MDGGREIQRQGAPAGYRGGAGEPMVMVHGLGGSWRNWAPILPAMQRHHDVWALDLPGFGSAPPLDDGAMPSVPTYADWIEGVLNEAGLQTAHLVGNSMGGWIALELARRGVGRTVTLISPAGVGTRTEGFFASGLVAATHRLARLASPVSDQLMRPWMVRSMLMGYMYARPDRLSADQASESVRTFGHSPSFDEARKWLYENRLAPVTHIACPCRILWGTRDHVLPIRLAQQYVERVPGSKLVRLPGLGHVPMGDDPELVANAILDFTAPNRIVDSTDSDNDDSDGGHGEGGTASDLSMV